MADHGNGAPEGRKRTSASASTLHGKHGLRPKRQWTWPDVRPYVFLGGFLVVFLSIFAFDFSILPSTGTRLLLCALALAGMLSLIFIFGVFKCHRLDFSEVFLIALIVLGLMYVVITGPLREPDEPGHYLASYWYSNLLIPEITSDEGFPMRADDATFFTPWNASVVSNQYALMAEQWSWGVLDDSAATVGYETHFDMLNRPLWFYFIPSLGITIGKLIGLGAVPTYYLGRLFAFVPYVVLSYFAIRITPVGKPALAFIALLPMSLALGTSYSWDGLLISASLLLTALCLQCLYGKAAIALSTKIAILVLIFIVTSCKVFYGLIAVLLVFMPKESMGRRSKWTFVLLALACFLSSLIVFNLNAIIGVLLGERVVGGADQFGVDLGQLHSAGEFLSDPLGTLWLFFNTLSHLGGLYLVSFFGTVLGFFNVSVESREIVFFGFGILLLFAFLIKDADKPQLRLSARITALAIFVIAFFGILLSMFVGWTPVDSDTIDGVQGRYLIPLAGLLVLTFYGGRYSFGAFAIKPAFCAFYGFSLCYALNVMTTFALL